MSVGDVMPIESTAKKATATNSTRTIKEMMMVDAGEWYFICGYFVIIILLGTE